MIRIPDEGYWNIVDGVEKLNSSLGVISASVR
jgi:hypothetical protein